MAQNLDTNQGPRRIPRLAIFFGILAALSLVFSSSNTYPGYFSGYGVLSTLTPLFFLVGIGGFFFGLLRYITGATQEIKDRGVRILLWSLGGLVMVYGLSLAVRTPIYHMGVSSSPPVAPMMESGSYRGGDTTGSASMIAPDYYPYPGPEVPVTDTREFLKRDYHATIQTRNVQELTRRAETTIRGFDGRIDQTSSSPKYGHIGFVVPASKFEDFRAEIESFVHPRFLTVNISSQNLLPQKQSIEEQQKYAEKSLADLRSERKQIVATHNNVVVSLQSQIDTNAAEEAKLRAEVTNDANRQAQIANRLTELANQKANLKSQLSNENASYASNLRSIDSQIGYAETNLTTVKKQDQNLLDTVATVSGTISIQWISLWPMVQLYLPGFWIPSILGILAVLSYWWDRKRFVM